MNRQASRRFRSTCIVLLAIGLGFASFGVPSQETGCGVAAPSADGLSPSVTDAGSVAAPGRVWVNGYYPGTEQARMPPSTIDFSALTHITHFSLLPKADGALDRTTRALTEENVGALVPTAHAAGTKVLVSLGGASSAPQFQAATATGPRAVLVENLVRFVSEHGYDGVDLDWEPLTERDVEAFTDLVFELRARLDEVRSTLLLTVAVSSCVQPWIASTLLTIESQVDQVNVMTYDMSGPRPGWPTWYNGPLYADGRTLPSSSTLLPSVNGSIRKLIDAGLPAAKLGIGIAFYGYVWHGVSGPNQELAGAWTEAKRYSEIMDTYFSPAAYRWDEGPRSSHLDIEAAEPDQRLFISYDDERSTAAKVDYARSNQLGGVIIWNLAQGFRANQPEGQRDVLLQAVKRAALK